MPITTIQSLFPTRIVSTTGAVLVRVGDSFTGWLGDGVRVILGGLIVRVAVTSGLMLTKVGVGLNGASTEVAIAILASANSKKRVKIVSIRSFLVIVPKFTKKGDGVSPQYNTPERRVFLSNFNLSSIMPAVMGSSYTFHINMKEKWRILNKLSIIFAAILQVFRSGN